MERWGEERLLTICNRRGYLNGRLGRRLGIVDRKSTVTGPSARTSSPLRRVDSIFVRLTRRLHYPYTRCERNSHSEFSLMNIRSSGPVPRILRNSRGARPVNSILTFHPFFRPDSFVVSRHARFNRSRSRFSSCNDSSNPLNFFLSLPRPFWPRSFPRDFESISFYSLKENQLSIELENSLRNVISMKRIFGTILSRKNVSNSIFNPIRTSVSVF